MIPFIYVLKEYMQPICNNVNLSLNDIFLRLNMVEASEYFITFLHILRCTFKIAFLVHLIYLKYINSNLLTLKICI